MPSDLAGMVVGFYNPEATNPGTAVRPAVKDASERMKRLGRFSHAQANPQRVRHPGDEESAPTLRLAVPGVLDWATAAQAGVLKVAEPDSLRARDPVVHERYGVGVVDAVPCRLQTSTSHANVLSCRRAGLERISGQLFVLPGRVRVLRRSTSSPTEASTSCLNWADDAGWSLTSRGKLTMQDGTGRRASAASSPAAKGRKSQIAANACPPAPLCTGPAQAQPGRSGVSLIQP
jgi:hypothetical protein